MAEETVGELVWRDIFLCVSKPTFPGWFLDEPSRAGFRCGPLACCKVAGLFPVFVVAAVGMARGCLVEVAGGVRRKKSG